MASPLTVKRNDYHKHKKNSTIYTPVGVAQFLFDTLDPALRPAGHFTRDPTYNGYFTVFDPAIGTGRLTDPWRDNSCMVLGCDLAISTDRAESIIKGRFEDCTWDNNWPIPDLALCNPPFNGAPGKQLYPEVFLRHIFELFGPKIPTVMFAPMGFRLNQRRKSKRFRWLRDCEAETTSIVALPLDTFDAVEFHAEILIFNVYGIQPHYFLPEEALR